MLLVSYMTKRANSGTMSSEYFLPVNNLTKIKPMRHVNKIEPSIRRSYPSVYVMTPNTNIVMKTATADKAVKSMKRVIMFFVNANMRSATNHATMYVSAFSATALLIFGSSMVAFAKPYATSD